LFQAKEERDNITLRLYPRCLIIDRSMHGAYLYTHFTRGRTDTISTHDWNEVWKVARHDNVLMLLYSPNKQIFRQSTTKLYYNLIDVNIHFMFLVTKLIFVFKKKSI